MSSRTLRVVVTGGSGRIGQAVCRELAARGHTVLNLDRRPGPADLPAKFHYVDMTRREQVQPLLDGADAVIQLAEITHASAPYAANEIFSHNTTVASLVLQTAADLRVPRVVYTSSCQIYGCWDDPRVPPLHVPFDETHPAQPQNVYALSKVANEQYCQWVSRATGLSVAIFRFPWVIPFEPDDQWLGWLDARQEARLDGMGTYVGASDAARAYALAVEKPRAGCEAYHFTAADILSAVPLVERWRKLDGYPALPADWPGSKSPVLLDKAKEHLGWEPQWSILDKYRAMKARQMKA